MILLSYLSNGCQRKILIMQTISTKLLQSDLKIDVKEFIWENECSGANKEVTHTLCIFIYILYCDIYSC